MRKRGRNDRENRENNKEEIFEREEKSRSQKTHLFFSFFPFHYTIHVLVVVFFVRKVFINPSFSFRSILSNIRIKRERESKGLYIVFRTGIKDWMTV